MLEQMQWVRPEEIEGRSMEIIEQEMPAGDWTPEELAVVKRCIHTSADFDYAENLHFSDGAVEKILHVLRAGESREESENPADTADTMDVMDTADTMDVTDIADTMDVMDTADAMDVTDTAETPETMETIAPVFTIVTDTNMAAAGVNKQALKKLGGEVRCFMADPEVAAEAKERGVTRAIVSMEHAARVTGPVIFAIGNAPTALIRLYEMMQAGEIHPAFIIGAPVGFVNVVESKELICETDVPCIVARGRKGGSNIAAAICNALMYLVTRS